MIEAVFFDFDGVIVESNDIKTKAFGKLFEPEGKDISERVIAYHLQNAGVSRFDKFRHIYKEMLKRPLSDDELDGLCSRFEGLVKSEVLAAPFVMGAIEFLEKYHSKYKLFVVSATPKDELESIICGKAIAKFFKKVYGAPFGKTDAVREVLKDEGLKGSNAVYVGDAMSDYKAAFENNVNFIARINGNETIFDDIDCIKIDDITKLEQVIEGLG